MTIIAAQIEVATSAILGCLMPKIANHIITMINTPKIAPRDSVARMAIT